MTREKQKLRTTIFALASGYGRSGVAVFRISGPAVSSAYQQLTKGLSLPVPRLASLQKFYLPTSGQLLDIGLALFFPAPHSYTGEDVLELQLHGGLNIIRSCLTALAALPGLRLAEPGEFTKRAFLNGQLDLTAAEAVADLINAETAAQRLQALEQLEGEQTQVYRRWSQELLQILAFQEALIDFSDQELGGDLPRQLEQRATALKAELEQQLTDRRGEKIRSGLQVVIVGLPNVGKSSLLNALAGQDCAIVTAQAGTTRDLVEVRIDLQGLPVTLVDTAGLTQTEDLIEREGIKRARQRAAKAELKLLVLEASDLLTENYSPPLPLDERTLLVANKADLVSSKLPSSYRQHTVLAISAKNGSGLEPLLAAIAKQLQQQVASGGKSLMTNARQRAAVAEAATFLGEAKKKFFSSPELAAEELRLANRALGRITGRTGVEQLLDQIFSSFCLGK